MAQPRHIVLLGAGHTHLHVVNAWRRRPLAAARLTLVSNFPIATYSGMLPGTLAGLYRPEALEIDLSRLCGKANVDFVLAEPQGADLRRRRLSFEGRDDLEYDLLSIGVGSVPDRSGIEADDETLLAIKPMQTFLKRLERRLGEWRAADDVRTLRIAVVGGGAAGVEIALCLPAGIRRIVGNVSTNKPPQPIQTEITLVDRHERLLSGYPPKAVAIVRRLLDERNIKVALGREVRALRDGRMTFDDGAEQPLDVGLLATAAVAPEILAAFNLPHDERGFLQTGPTLQSTADDRVFVVGDTASRVDQHVPKAGVYAVRQGPILWENLGRRLHDEPLAPYVPQHGFLSLLATGDARAILCFKGFTAHGRWCWWLKDAIDGRFIRRFQA